MGYGHARSPISAALKAAYHPKHQVITNTIGGIMKADKSAIVPGAHSIWLDLPLILGCDRKLFFSTLTNIIAECRKFVVQFTMFKNDGDYLDGSRLHNMPEWPRFEVANDVSWLVYCGCMNRDTPTCDWHFERKAFTINTPAIAPVECRVLKPAKVSRGRVAFAWLTFLVTVVESLSGIAPRDHEEQARHALHVSSRRQRGTVRRPDYTFQAGQESNSQPQDRPGRNEPGPEGARKTPSGAETERSPIGPQRLPDSQKCCLLSSNMQDMNRNDVYTCSVCLANPHSSDEGAHCGLTGPDATTHSYPTDFRERRKIREKAAKEAGTPLEVVKKKKIVEDHYDDCGEDLLP